MPHFILEYSDNLGQSDESIAEFQKTAHQIAIDSKLFALKGIRSRAYPNHQYHIADGNLNHGFAHLTVKIGTGRTEDEKAQFTQQIFEHLIQHFDSGRQGVALSIELTELEPVYKHNHNTIEQYW